MGWFDDTRIASSVISFLGGERRNQQAKEQARTQMGFQRDMSNTAYERAMADMKRSGLNPILAAKIGGASTPPGAMANIQDPLTPAVQTGLQASKTESDVALNKSKEALTRVQENLQSNLIPGSEALAVLTKNAAELLQSVDNILDKNLPGYEEMLNSASDAFADVFSSVPDANKFVGDLVSRLKKKGMSESVIKSALKGVLKSVPGLDMAISSAKALSGGTGFPTLGSKKVVHPNIKRKKKFRKASK